MCGIAGELRWGPGGARREAVDALVSGIIHRGPDDRGLWASANNTCVLGHARLSVVDLSAAGHQPMLDPLTGNAIVFNGEIYNFKSLREECESYGDTFVSRSDTEVILALYRRHGVDCLEYLRGMFAFALWDERRQHLFLARDRLGKKPLNYAPMGTGLAFCSELYPLSRHPNSDDELDLDALDIYLQCQFIPAPWTIYRGIRKLPPAHYAICDSTSFRTTRYWDVDYRDKIRISESDAIDALEEKLTEAVRLRMIADVPIGALLSGGVDSSLVVALMAKIAAQPVRTFSIGFEAADFNELRWAQQAATRCGTRHHVDVVSGDIAPSLDRLARHYGEPFADDSAVPSFAVSHSARQHVTVAMNGDGGDELLGGYGRYFLSSAALSSSALFGRLSKPGRLVEAALYLADAKRIHERIARRVLTRYANPELRSIIMFSNYWHEALRRELLPNGSGAALRNWRHCHMEDAFRHGDNPIDRMLWFDSHTYLPGCLLVKMDIASMHCGLETRSPLLDHEVIEFCARLPMRHKVRDQVGKYLLKRLAERHFPKAFVYRPKQGFGVPLADWLRGPLHKLLNETLRDGTLMAPLSVPVIKRTLQQFHDGYGEHQQRLWTLLMFGCWRRVHGI